MDQPYERIPAVEPSRPRVFEHPSNGHREEVTGWASVGAFCFGLLYFAVRGAWRHFVFQLIFIIGTYAAFGPPATMFVAVMWIAYAVMAPGIICSQYLRNGWRQVPVDERAEVLTSAPASSAGPQDGERLCPFCAEIVKAAAIKCKHCGSELTPAS